MNFASKKYLYVTTFTLLLGFSCGDSPKNPVPSIQDLSCRLSFDASTSTFQGEFEIAYVDEDRDLGEGGAVLWWLNDVEQSSLDLTSVLLSEGTMTLTLSGFPAYEALDAVFQLEDRAGNQSNRAEVYLYTVVGEEECRLTSLGE